MAICPSCQAESPDGFRFCGACGAPLPAEVRSDRRERRIVSVLFADLVGFTSRSERADVEDVDALLAPYVELLRREIERHGGGVPPVSWTPDGRAGWRVGKDVCRCRRPRRIRRSFVVRR